LGVVEEVEGQVLQLAACCWLGAPALLLLLGRLAWWRWGLQGLLLWLLWLLLLRGHRLFRFLLHVVAHELEVRHVWLRVEHGVDGCRAHAQVQLHVLQLLRKPTQRRDQGGHVQGAPGDEDSARMVVVGSEHQLADVAGKGLQQAKKLIQPVAVDLCLHAWHPDQVICDRDEGTIGVPEDR
jgi:hypothetical protein